MFSSRTGFKSDTFIITGFKLQQTCESFKCTALFINMLYPFFIIGGKTDHLKCVWHLFKLWMNPSCFRWHECFSPTPEALWGVQENTRLFRKELLCRQASLSIMHINTHTHCLFKCFLLFALCFALCLRWSITGAEEAEWPSQAAPAAGAMYLHPTYWHHPCSREPSNKSLLMTPWRRRRETPGREEEEEELFG